MVINEIVKEVCQKHDKTKEVLKFITSLLEEVCLVLLVYFTCFTLLVYFYLFTFSYSPTTSLAAFSNLHTKAIPMDHIK